MPRFSPFPYIGGGPKDRAWVAMVADRYSYVITYTEGLGYDASWKDRSAPPRQAAKLVTEGDSFRVCLRACRRHAAKMTAH